MTEGTTLTRPSDGRRPTLTCGPDYDRALAVQATMRPPRKTPSTITDVLRRWAAGHDTATIAAATGIPQADVCRIVAADQDRRHAVRQARHG